MLKKLLCVLYVAHAVSTYVYAQDEQVTNPITKIEQLYKLQDVAQTLNRIKPVGMLHFTVPPFIELTTQDIQQMLAAVPSGIMSKRGRKEEPMSMLEFIQNIWRKVVDQAHMHKKFTPAMRDHLIEIRAAIESAFHHDPLNTPLRPQVRAFLERQREQKNSIIIRRADGLSLFNTKSVYPFTAETLNHGIARALNSKFTEKAILELTDKGLLNQPLDLTIILQSIVTEDPDEKQFIISGVSCSYDTSSNIPHVITIHALFGDAKALNKSDIPTDTYYIHDQTVYPIIRKKANRFLADTQTARTRLTPNPTDMQLQSSLNLHTALEIARATKLIEEIYQEPICLNFIKRDNTIYLINIQKPDPLLNTQPSYFDPFYIEQIASDKQVSVTPIKPTHSLVTVKKRQKIILAPNVRSFIAQLNKRKKPEDVDLGIIKKMPAPFSKEARLLNEVTIPVIWSPDFEQLRSWINERTFPLVFDMQQKIAFQFSRARGFCTMFQGVQKGILAHPLASQISLMPEFMLPINQGEREMLKPDEYFSGVTLAHLFNLLKTESPNIAESALNTILFRLQKQISAEYITKKECDLSLKPFDMNRCELMKKMYEYVERVAYQLKKLLKNFDSKKPSSADILEKIFLINILQAVVLQQPNSNIAGTESFMHVAK